MRDMSDEAIRRRVNDRVARMAADMSDAELAEELESVGRAVTALRSSRVRAEREQAEKVADEIDILRAEQARRRPN